MTVEKRNYSQNEQWPEETPAWFAFKNCRDVSPNIMVPLELLDNGAPNPMYDVTVAKAKSYCNECPVIDPCLDYGIELAKKVEDHGVLGGTTRLERAEIVQIEMLFEPDPNYVPRTVLKTCGTESGARAHRRLKEPLCIPCLRAEHEGNRRRYRARKSTEPNEAA